ncbi:MAG: hypothetical protein HXK04_00250 [Actinomyces graevenitzii]|nr:hypothetical protein [Actinomyces graevenitzii]
MCTFKAAGRRRQNSGADKNAAQAKRKAAGRRRRQGTKPGAVAARAPNRAPSPARPALTRWCKQNIGSGKSGQSQ